MNFCEDNHCNCIGNAFCLCKSKFYCEKHLKEHLQTESRKRSFGFSYNNQDLITKSKILSFLDSLITFTKRHKYSYIISSIEEGSYLNIEWCQKLEKINEDIDYYQNLINEIEACQELFIKNTRFPQSLLFFPVNAATKLLYHHLLGRISENFSLEVKNEMIESKNTIKLKVKINEILLLEKHMENIIKGQTNIKLPNFNITIKLLDDSKLYWDHIKELKSKIKQVKNYYKYSKVLFKNLQDDTLKHFYENIYNNFLETVSSFNNAISKKEKDLSIHHGKIIYNIFQSTMHSHTVIIPFDCDTEKFECNIIDSEKYKRMPLIDISSCITVIPNSGLFVFGRFFGGWEAENQSYACKIAAKFQMRIIENSSSRSYPGCVYYQNCVYVFGGIWSSVMGLSMVEKFNLEADKWFKSCPLPTPSCSCACIAYYNSILVSGNLHSKIYKYDIDLDGYSEILTNLNTGNKVLLYGNSRIYVIEQPGAIYESDAENEFKWNKINNSFMNSYRGQTCWSLNKNSIYFSQSDGSLTFHYYKFNLQTKKFKILKIVNTYFLTK